jgi:hypothetical protein
MPKLNTVLQTAFLKLGLDLTNESVKTIIGNESLSNIEVSEDVSNYLSQDFYTKDSASQNLDIRNKIKAEILNGEDARQNELFSKFEMPDDVKSHILNEKNTLKRYSLIAEKIAELTELKHKSKGVDKDALNSEIAKLNKQIVDIKSQYENEINNERFARKQDRINWELDSIYNQFDYALPVDKSISVTAAKAIMNKIASDKGIVFETTDNGIKIKTKEGTDYFDNNQVVSPSDFIKRSLIENKLLKTAPDASQNQQQQQSSNRQSYQRQQPPMKSFDSAVDSLINQNPF